MSTKHVIFTSDLTARVAPLYTKSFHLIFKGDDRQGVIHEINGRIVGMVVCNIGICTLISDMCVDNRYRGYGIARKLIEAVIEEYPECCLQIDLHSHMLPHAIKLYRGFEIKSRDDNIFTLIHTGRDKTDEIIALINAYLQLKLECSWIRITNPIRVPVFDVYPSNFNNLNPFILLHNRYEAYLHSPSPILFTPLALSLRKEIIEYLFIKIGEGANLNEITLEHVLRNNDIDVEEAISENGLSMICVHSLLSICLYRPGCMILDYI